MHLQKDIPHPQQTVERNQKDQWKGPDNRVRMEDISQDIELNQEKSQNLKIKPKLAIHENRRDDQDL